MQPYRKYARGKTVTELRTSGAVSEIMLPSVDGNLTWYKSISLRFLRFRFALSDKPGSHGFVQHVMFFLSPTQAGSGREEAPEDLMVPVGWWEGRGTACCNLQQLFSLKSDGLRPRNRVTWPDTPCCRSSDLLELTLSRRMKSEARLSSPCCHNVPLAKIT